MPRAIPADLRLPNLPPLMPLGESGAKIIDFLPWAFPPHDSTPIDVVDVQAALGPGASATILIIDARANNGVLRFFGNECAAAAGYADIRWTLTANGLAIPPYNAMQLSRGAIQNPDPVMIPIEKGTKIECIVNNVSGVNTWEVRTRVKGWLY